MRPLHHAAVATGTATGIGQSAPRRWEIFGCHKALI